MFPDLLPCVVGDGGQGSDVPGGGAPAAWRGAAGGVCWVREPVAAADR